jgi:serine/threonine-protein kinase RsbW
MSRRREQHFELPATTASLRELQQAVERMLATATPPVDERTSYEITLAVQEMAANIVEHAYGGRGGLLRVRIRLLPARFGRPARFIAETEDQGAPFVLDLDSAAQEPAPTEDGLPSLRGRGLYLLVHLMDRVIYEPGPPLNHWRLERRLDGARDTGAS